VGTLWPDDQVVVSSQVEGPVAKVLVDVGDPVQTGLVMVTLDTEEFRNQIEQRTAAMRKIMAQLGLSQDEAEIRDIADLPEVKKAAAALFDAEQRYRRSQALFKQSLVAQQDLDTADSRYRSAKADYDVVVQQVKTLQSDLRSQKAQLALAEKKLRDTDIRAPFAGYIQERQASPGQYLKVQTPVMTIVKPNPLRLRADVPEKMAAWVKTGQNVEISGEAFPDKTFAGPISRITPAVKEQSRSFVIEALIANPNLILKPGAFVKAKVTTSKVDSALLVSEKTLNYLFGTYKVFVVEDGRLKERDIKLGDRFGDQIEVTEGVRAGDWVALHPEQLKEGMPVRVDDQGSRSGN
jgi:membrane fusion protein (multidrug efflux system)